MYDPVRLGESLEKVVVEGDRRKYYRFRGARWYGGIATGDVVGCNLFCHFCWARDDVRLNASTAGEFYSPDMSFAQLDGIARSKGYGLLRLSGQEPTIGKEHLLALLGLVDRSPHQFILETNGIMIGDDPDYAPAIARHRRASVRVSLKGASEEEFGRLTGARPEGFGLQLKALENLHEAGANFHAALMTSFSSRENLDRLRERLSRIDPSIADNIEVEELILYPHVVQRLEREGISASKAHRPDRVPPELV